MTSRRTARAATLLLGLVLALAGVVSIGGDTTAQAQMSGATFTVDTTAWADDADVGDGVCDDGSGACTLKAAIQEANAVVGTDEIAFDIPGPAPHVIELFETGDDTAVTEQVVIDGTTQPDFGGCPTGATVEVRLTNVSQNAISALPVTAPDTVIRGLRFHSIDRAPAVDLRSGADRTRLTCNVFGDPTATLGLTTRTGIRVASDDNVIGGTTPAEGNLFQRTRSPIDIGGSGNVVAGNTFVSDPNPDVGIGVSIGGSDNTVGGVAPGAGNTFAGVNAAAVYVEPGASGNAILGNSIDGTQAANYEDGPPGLGIDLLEGTEVFGVTANDPGDADTGANELQNFPDLTSASAAGGTTTVEGSLSSEANETYRIEFFSSPACDPSGYGEGEVFLGATSETTDGSGLVPFTAELPVSVAPGDVVTATATDEGNNTSEFSACVTVALGSDDGVTHTVDTTEWAEDANVGDGVCDDGLGACTLKAAIQEANAVPGTPEIAFDIPGPAPHVITVFDQADTQLAVTDQVVIDGTTQPDFGGCPAGATIEILPDIGSQTPSALAVEAPETTITGLAFVRNGQRPAVALRAGADRTTLTCNSFGDPAATINDTLRTGIAVLSDDNVIGGTAPAEGNLFLRTRLPVDVGGSGNVIEGNTFTSHPNPDVGIGVSIAGSDNTVGGVAPGAGNTFAGVNAAAVFVYPGATGNAILGNSIDGTQATTYEDGPPGLGIDLLGAPEVFGITANDPGDADTGANEFQNFPDLTSASAAGGTTTIEGSLSSEANETYRIEFFSSPVCDPSGYGEGEVFLGATSETTNGSGLVPFTAELPVSVAPGAVVTATATDEGNNTSEFSACVTVVASGGDADSDGVEDSIDVGAGAFDDGSGTSGAITNANGLDVLVSDADDSADGVKITVSGASAVDASFTICGFPILISGGSEIVVTCGSVTVEVVEGSAEIVLGGGAVVVSVPAGGTVKVTDEGGTFYNVENLGPTTITVNVDGTASLLPAGESSSVSTDVTDPTVTCNSAAFLLNQPAALVTATVSDGESGPAQSTVSAAAGTASPGPQSVQVTGFDEAGNSKSVSCAYSVRYAFEGFLQPIDNLPTVNSAKAGQTIPVKWRIADYFGVGVANPSSFSSISSGSLNCDPSDPQDAIETYVDSSGLQYLGNGTWQFNWKTPKTYAGQCRVMRLNLADGASNRTAEFRFK